MQEPNGSYDDTTKVEISSPESTCELGPVCIFESNDEEYPDDFTYPMAVIYEYLTFRDNWNGILPFQWVKLYAKVPIAPNYFALDIRKDELLSRNQMQLLAIIYNKEADQMTLQEQARGGELIWNLVELGPRVRRMMAHGKWTFESSIEPLEVRITEYVQNLVRIETMICESLEAVQAWIKSVIFVSLSNYFL